MSDVSSVPARGAKAVEVIRANPNSIMSLDEAKQLDAKHAKESDYYSVLLVDDRSQQQLRVRTVVWELDAERMPVLDENGKRKVRNAHEVGLDVWAAYGADEYSLLTVSLGGQIRANPDSIATELALGHLKMGG